MAMEQFRKWFSNGDYDYQICDYPEREAWKAALKWALSLQWETDDGAQAISSARLERELKNGKKS